MKNNILTFLFLFLFTLTAVGSEKKLTSEPYSIQWKDIIYDSAVPNGKMLSFEDASYSEEFLPYFHKTINLKDNTILDSVEIRNIQYTEISQDEKSLLTHSNITFSDRPSIKISYTTDRKQKKVQLSVLPFIRKNDDIKKITSFELCYQTNTTISLRNTNANDLHQYAASSVLANGKWVKVSVSKSGIYKISYEDLVNWGIANPARAQVFGYGGAMLLEDFSKAKKDDLPQVSIWREKGSDGIFNAGDYILFYAQGPIAWEYNYSTKEFEQTINPYSNLGYYFISSDVATEKEILQRTDIAGTHNSSVDYFLDYQLHEKELFNFISSGRKWFGEEFNNSTSNRSFSFSFPHIDTEKTARITIEAATDNTSSTSEISVSINNTIVGSVSLPKKSSSDRYSHATFNTGHLSFNPASSSLSVNLRYNQYAAAKAWLKYIRINAFRKLTIDGNVNAFFFRNPDIVAENQIAQYNINGSPGFVFWDISQPEDATQISVDWQNSLYSFIDNASTLKEYVAINPYASFPTPTFEGNVANQNLHAQPQTDYVIITHPDFVAQSQQLAQLHNQKNGLSVLVVTPEQVYNEFSSGNPDATAFRWLMKMFYDRASSEVDMPKYLLLMGDGNYDNKGIKNPNSPNRKLLTFQSNLSTHATQSYVTDDYFALLDDNEGSDPTAGSMDIAVGRIPVSTTEEADIIVRKIASYMDNNQLGYWKNRLCYIADDDDGTLFTSQSDNLVKDVEQNFPDFQPIRLFLDAYQQQKTASGESYPQVIEKLDNLLNTGILVLNFLGHGSTEGVTGEQLITRNRIATMRNKKYPFTIAGTCSFSQFDDNISSSGEDLFMKADAGAIAVFSATRDVYISNNYTLNKAITNHLLLKENGEALGMGEIIRRGKNEIRAEINKRNYILLGDPALKLSLPNNSVVITNIESNSTAISKGTLTNSHASTDTIQALSTVKITGKIVSPDNQPLSDFNGTLNAVVYDKQKTSKTLGNESSSIYSFIDRPNIIFNGKASVENGEFSFSFLIPKDISFDYGFGRVNFYAYEDNNLREANGYSDSLLIGGNKSDFVFENTGPTIDLYINSPFFRSGENVNASSVFYADISDENGINTSNIGIGHNLLLTLSNKSESYILNDYFEYKPNSYKSGTVTYKLPTLNDGHYTLSFRAWDLLNNSTTKSIDFYVNNSEKPKVHEFIAGPNPAHAYVNFFIKHNQPQTNLNIKIEVYKITGEKYWSTTENTFTEDNQTIITWDFGGRKPLPGIYIYQVIIESEQNGKTTSKANKLIVK